MSPRPGAVRRRRSVHRPAIPRGARRRTARRPAGRPEASTVTRKSRDRGGSSRGFGRRFREGFMPAIGDRELEDIEAAVRWPVAEGVADPDKVFVTGASYGGFLSLLSVGRLPGLSAGAPAHVPMADWPAGHEDMKSRMLGLVHAALRQLPWSQGLS
ncbi:S9 family peptidase [Streptomyces sp. Ag109_O5-1]|uniref:S9 family peptidase n=1 Tax=Streptomyces sp. Ag109_O5-1 TaxID=1938851 RepID=UPI0021A6AE73|nr:S9 family peptidase [Streptomyces sp. Ag109_O5-1]